MSLVKNRWPWFRWVLFHLPGPFVFSKRPMGRPVPSFDSDSYTLDPPDLQIINANHKLILELQREFYTRIPLQRLAKSPLRDFTRKQTGRVPQAGSWKVLGIGFLHLKALGRRRSNTSAKYHGDLWEFPGYFGRPGVQLEEDGPLIGGTCEKCALAALAEQAETAVVGSRSLAQRESTF